MKTTLSLPPAAVIVSLAFNVVSLRKISDDRAKLQDLKSWQLQSLTIISNLNEQSLVVLNKVQLHEDYFQVLRRQLGNPADKNPGLDPATGLPR